MEIPYAAPPPPMGQSPFFFYNPEPDSQHRQHGHFTPHPTEYQFSHAVPSFQHPSMPEQFTGYPPQAFGSRPSSSDSLQHFQSKPQYYRQMAMTPMASPRPIYQKPTILIEQHSPRLLSLDTQCAATDMYYFPSTPPLSTSGSTISSPPSSCGMIPTPVQDGFLSRESFEGVKEGCEVDVQSEILAGGDWARSGTPPMTPGKLNDIAEYYGGCICSV